LSFLWTKVEQTADCGQNIEEEVDYTIFSYKLL